MKNFKDSNGEDIYNFLKNKKFMINTDEDYSLMVEQQNDDGDLSQIFVYAKDDYKTEDMRKMYAIGTVLAFVPELLDFLENEVEFKNNLEAREIYKDILYNLSDINKTLEKEDD